MVVQLERKRFTVTDYQHMIETGILQEGEPYELLNGEVIRKMDYQPYPFPTLNQANLMGIGKRHASSTKRLNVVFSDRLHGQALIGVQAPVQLSEYSEPQPDISILKLNPDFYLSHHPAPDDIYLLVEVADSTLELDRTIKLPLYAEAGIAEVWIVNLQDRGIEVYRNPAGTTYQSIQTMTQGQTLTIALLPGVTIAVHEILG